MPDIIVKPVKDAAALPGYWRAAAEINYGFGRRERLWFDCSEAPARAAGDCGDVWLLGLLPLAFRTGRRLRICAPVDSVLLRNAEAIMRVWAGWFPALAPVEIVAEAATGQEERGGRTGLFFTGGVDSFFTALHYDEMVRSGVLPGARLVENLIFVGGFDIPLKHTAEFGRKQEWIADAAREMGKNLITITTNLRETRLRKLDWGMHTHGMALGAAGLLCGTRFKQILLSSSFVIDDSRSWGSHRRVDPLMSSSRTEIIHYGADFGRMDKTAFISRSEVALRYLHVCWKGGTARNCGVCEKCYRTLLSLEVLGRREKAASFPAGRFSLDHFRTISIKDLLIVDLYEEIRRHALEHSRPDVVKAIDERMASVEVGSPGKSTFLFPRLKKNLRRCFGLSGGGRG